MWRIFQKLRSFLVNEEIEEKSTPTISVELNFYKEKKMKKVIREINREITVLACIQNLMV